MMRGLWLSSVVLLWFAPRAAGDAIASFPDGAGSVVGDFWISEENGVAANDLKLPAEGNYKVHTHTTGDIRRVAGNDAHYAGPVFTFSTGIQFDGTLGSIVAAADGTGTFTQAPGLSLPLSGENSLVGRSLVIVPDEIVIKVSKIAECRSTFQITLAVGDRNPIAPITVTGTEHEQRIPLSLTADESIGLTATDIFVSVSTNARATDDGIRCKVSIGTVEGYAVKDFSSGGLPHQSLDQLGLYPDGSFPTIFITEGRQVRDSGEPCREDVQCKSLSCIGGICAIGQAENTYFAFGTLYALGIMGMLMPATDGAAGNADGQHYEAVDGVRTLMQHGEYEFTPLGTAPVAVLSTAFLRATASATIGTAAGSGQGNADTGLFKGAPGQKKLICVMVESTTEDGGNVFGSVLISHMAGTGGSSTAMIEASVSGLNPNTEHSFHFHTFGDISGYAAVREAGDYNDGNWGPVFPLPGDQQLPELTLSGTKSVAKYSGEFDIANIDEFNGRSITIHRGPRFTDTTVAWAVCGIADEFACLQKTCPIPEHLQDKNATDTRMGAVILVGTSPAVKLFLTFFLAVLAVGLMILGLFVANQMIEEDDDDDYDSDDEEEEKMMGANYDDGDGDAKAPPPTPSRASGPPPPTPSRGTKSSKKTKKSKKAKKQKSVAVMDGEELGTDDVEVAVPDAVPTAVAEDATDMMV